MLRNALRSFETNTSTPPVINLAEGIHFEDPRDFKQLLEVIEGRLAELGLLSPGLLLAGYKAWHDDHSEMPDRKTTWALPLSQVREEVDKNPDANNPFVYSGLKYPTPDNEPTIAAYDPNKLQPISGDPRLAMKYAALPGYTLGSAKLVEFPIILASNTVEAKQAK